MRLVGINEAENCSPIDESDIITERDVDLRAVQAFFLISCFLSNTYFLIFFLFTATSDLEVWVPPLKCLHLAFYD